MLKQLQQLIAKKCPPPNPNRWDNSPLATYIREEEQSLLETVVTDLFGYHLLQIGSGYGLSGVEKSRISNRVLLLQKDENFRSERASIVRVENDALPIASDSVDVVILPHTLELENEPYQLLREVDRILIAEGHLVIVGHDPLSLWGLRKLFRVCRNSYPWDRQYFSRRRVRDWMGLLGFDTEKVIPFLYLPPIQRLVSFAFARKFDRVCQQFMPALGGGYLYIAKKRVSTLTPIRPQWRFKRHFVDVGLSESTSRRERM